MISIIEILYLIASVTFILGLKMMSNPKSARKGNLIAAFGMTLAIFGTMFIADHEVPTMIYVLIIVAMIIGTIIGWMTAKKVAMTKMPELVSMFNGMGGACAALISIIEFSHYAHLNSAPQYGFLAAIAAGLVIGSVSFSGSVIAFLKLNGTMNKPIRIPSYNIVNTAVLIGIILFAAYFVYINGNLPFAYLLFAAALIYGIMFVLPIGGADMPVVISLLNSFTGLAAAFGGFLYDNKVMLTGGILVGSAGTLLTIVMCKAMNRPLSNVIFGAFGGSNQSGEGKETTGSIK
ncbi:MAG TPA: NAD(P)(+) transhydrogenase (Re/Si-specific) subunit beta, partial [Bacteroidia bacterium]|nr:NAD(P)(+) transhydrogenase (Re/Si-specific) subunit beta [Bacteroidia bacterium]